jgi:hypothetical protein
MSFDAWIVGFGLSTLLRDLQLVPGNRAFLALILVVILDSILLYRFFTVQLPAAVAADRPALTPIRPPLPDAASGSSAGSPPA